MKPPHVAAYIEMLGLPEPDRAGLSKPSVKPHSDGSSLAKAREMANHADTRTTQLYDRRADVGFAG